MNDAAKGDTPMADALARELVENDAHICPTAEHPFWRLLELARELERKAAQLERLEQQRHEAKHNPPRET